MQLSTSIKVLMMSLLLAPLLISCKGSHEKQAATGNSTAATTPVTSSGRATVAVSPGSETTLTWTVGNVRITRILERAASGQLSKRLKAVDGKITPEAIAPYREWLAPHFLDENDAFMLSQQSFLIQSMGKRIIVDTSAGESPPEYLRGFSRLTDSYLDDLAAAGFAPDSVDVVIATHFHADHVGWNTIKSYSGWVPTFQNARYIMSRLDYESLATEPQHIFYANFSEAVAPVVSAGLAELIDGRYRVTEEVWLEPTPGHTPGHLSVWVESAGERALLTGDASHHPVQWAEPDWAIIGEDDPELSTQTRRRLLEEYAAKPFLIIGGHYQTPTAGYLVFSEQGTRFVPLLPDAPASTAEPRAR
jgi:glyoxylase-like metal-dependent hydrolase (beta-lactamase superfamily II)